MLIKLTDNDYVNPDEVACVYVREYTDTAFVRLKNGIEYTIVPPYGMSKYQNLDRIYKLINDSTNLN
jgi:hypothetical protein